jgi:tetratricopeptide (TPR) repeat protein
MNDSYRLRHPICRPGLAALAHAEKPGSMVCWDKGAKKWLLLAGLLLSMGSAQAAPGVAINTDPSKLIGKTILFFKLDHMDAKLLEPACVVPLTNGGSGGQWFDMVRGHPLLDVPRYQILKGADSLHHYCRGQAAEIRYFKERDPVMKRRLLEEMIGEYVFMIGHPQYLPKNWPYMKVMHLELGNARMLEKKPAQAIRSFEQALSLDPAYEKAHIAYTDALVDMGLKAKALAQVTEGLRHNPDSRGHQRRYKELGGKLPYPEPYKKAVQEDANAVPDEPVAVPEKSQQIVPAVTEAEPAAAPEQAKIPPEPLVSPENEKKNSKNPYCRFCP